METVKTIYREMGVSYTFDKKTAKKYVMKPFYYDIWYEGTQVTTDKIVYCHNINDFHKLLLCWNLPPTWIYNTRDY